MNTKLVRVDVESLQDEAKKSQSLQILKEAGEIIKNGGLVAFPTETVYGLGGDALNPESSRKIYAAKGRPSDNPLIVHIADMEHLERITESIPEAAYTLAQHFWPGSIDHDSSKVRGSAFTDHGWTSYRGCPNAESSGGDGFYRSSWWIYCSTKCESVRQAKPYSRQIRSGGHGWQN